MLSKTKIKVQSRAATNEALRQSVARVTPSRKELDEIYSETSGKRLLREELDFRNILARGR